jgi:phosphoadenosine phosphosulfate reductase
VRGLADNATEAAPANPTIPADAGGDQTRTGEELTRSLSDTLRAAMERHGEKLVLLCSFQKEESVLLDELLRLDQGTGRAVRIVTIDTGVLFPETLATWRAFEERFGVDVDVEEAYGPWSASQCCGEAKVAALERALAGADAWITGIRREQAPTRAGAEPVEWDEKRRLWKYNPLVDWTEKDVWQRIHERDLPYHPLHDQGYDSIGCAPCTAPGNGREGRWAGLSKTECGIHV